MSELPSFTELIVVIAFVVPGFISLKIIERLYYDPEFSNLNITIYSIVLSLVGYLPIGFLLGITGIEDLKLKLVQPIAIIGTMVTGILLGLVIGLIGRHLDKGVSRFTPWDEFGKDYCKLKGRYVLVYSTKDKEYLGWLKRMSSKKHKHELCIGDPQIISRDKNFVGSGIDLGEELLFTEDDIARIVLLPVKNKP